MDFLWTSGFLRMETTVRPTELIGILVMQSTSHHETISFALCLLFDDPVC